MKQQTLSDYQLPESLTIERQVISDAVVNADMFPDMMQVVTPDMFYNPDTRRVWELLVGMYNSGEVIDVASVCTKGGEAARRFVLSGDASLIGASALGYYQHVNLLRDAAARRNLYFFALSLLGKSVDGNTSEEGIAGLLEGAQERVLPATPGTSSDLTQVVNEVAEELQRESELRRQGKTSRIRTGIQTLDWNLFQGFGPGQLVILAARPSVGKTAVMLQFAVAAATLGNHAQIFTLEMTRQELLKRMLFSTGFIRPAELAQGETPWAEFEKAASAISRLPLHIDDKSRHLGDICSKIRRECNKGNCKAAYIDYLQLIKTDGREQRYREVADITGELKALAKDMGVPVILLCQLSRNTARENRPPELYDLRESGDIEQDADIVLMLEQTDEYTTETSPPNLNLWVRKNRQYKKDFKIRLKPNDTYTKFYELTTEI